MSQLPSTSTDPLPSAAVQTDTNAAKRSGLRTFFARFGVGALIFFTVKGLVWLAVGGGIAAWATR